MERNNNHANKLSILRRIEATFMLVGYHPYIEDVVWPVDVPGVTAQSSPLQTTWLNQVGLATFNEETVDDGIAQVIAQYRQAGKRFRWFVGPTSQPTNLGERLTAAGLTYRGSIKGMVLHDIDQPIKRNPAIRVEQASFAEWNTHVSMIAQAFGMSRDVISIFNRCYTVIDKPVDFYLAYVPEQEEPVATAISVFDDQDLVVLLGAATLEAYRGRGIYTTMIAKRLEDARAKGATTAIIQCDPHTSAPICATLGFEQVCLLDSYVFSEELTE
jgi:GNAT superfamily N-acetyltransferase